MQFDRLLIRQATRLAPKLLSQLTKKRPAAEKEPTPEELQAEAIKADPRNDPDLRGSGSWANEWAGAKHAVERAKDFATNGRKPARVKSRMLEMPEIPEGSIRPRALMTAREVKLHNWIADRMELAAPTCSLHSGVALSAFLASDTIGALDGLVADMVIANETGDPVAVLVRDRKDDNARQIRLLDALIDSELPVIDLPDRISLSKLWGDIEMALPDDADEDAA